MTLRISEVYPSFQGEGPQVGQPTIFVRFAGCNMKCPGWPCDTPHAIDPKIFMKEQRLFPHDDIEDLANEILSYGIENVCFTGGEPLLQSSEDLESLLSLLRTNSHTPLVMSMFTNGTLHMTDKIRAQVRPIIIDWKLPDSGENPPWGPDTNLWHNLRKLGPDDAIKFTIASRHDFDKAQERYTHYLQYADFCPQVYCGVVWGKVSEAELCRWMLEAGAPWRLNVQLHKHIWDANARRT